MIFYIFQCFLQMKEKIITLAERREVTKGVVIKGLGWNFPKFKLVKSYKMFGNSVISM